MRGLFKLLEKKGSHPNTDLSSSRYEDMMDTIYDSSDKIMMIILCNKYDDHHVMTGLTAKFSAIATGSLSC